jgi:hypothetical protein
MPRLKGWQTYTNCKLTDFISRVQNMLLITVTLFGHLSVDSFASSFGYDCNVKIDCRLHVDRTFYSENYTLYHLSISEFFMLQLYFPQTRYFTNNLAQIARIMYLLPHTIYSPRTRFNVYQSSNKIIKQFLVLSAHLLVITMNYIKRK